MASNFPTFHLLVQLFALDNYALKQWQDLNHILKRILFIISQ